MINELNANRINCPGLLFIDGETCRSLHSLLGVQVKLVSHGTYDSGQQALTEAVLRAIKRELQAVDAPPELVEQLTGSIAFAVTSLLDDVASIEVNGEALSPVVTFQVADDELAFSGGNSWMHEYVYRLLPAVFDSIDGEKNADTSAREDSKRAL